MKTLGSILGLVVVTLAVQSCSPMQAQQKASGPAYGLAARIATTPYLRMPSREDGPMPALLSQTGAFRDVRHLVPAAGIVPYDLVVPFWSDGAGKSRLIAVPDGQIGFAPTGEWTFPKGTVFIKTFELPIDEAHPEKTQRLETRLLVVDEAGGVYGVAYKWRADHSDAELLPANATEPVSIRTRSGETRTQTWYYPSRKDCHTCHTPLAGGVLGVKTRQMNREIRYPSGITDNQLRAWNHIGLFSPGIVESDIASFTTLARADDTSRDVTDRARSYLDSNCAHCHRPGGTVANFDARYDTPLEQQMLVDGPVLIDENIDRARVIAPRDHWRSIAFLRVNTNSDTRMPPLARLTIDQHGVDLLQQWILSMPGRDVLAPPTISPSGGTFDAPVEVSLTTDEPGAEIRYTLDGSVPGTSDARYEKPVRIEGPTVLRARVYKEGFTRSIVTQQVFVFGH